MSPAKRHRRSRRQAPTPVPTEFTLPARDPRQDKKSPPDPEWLWFDPDPSYEDPDHTRIAAYWRKEHGRRAAVRRYDRVFSWWCAGRHARYVRLAKREKHFREEPESIERSTPLYRPNATQPARRKGWHAGVYCRAHGAEGTLLDVDVIDSRERLLVWTVVPGPVGRQAALVRVLIRFLRDIEDLHPWDDDSDEDGDDWKCQSTRV